MKVHSSVSRIDLLATIVILGLIAILAGTAFVVWRMGIEVVTFAPGDVAASTEIITVEFSEPMNQHTVAENFTIRPFVEGTLNWNETRVYFTPTHALRPGTEYTVTVDSGARSASGGRLHRAHSFTFTVRSPRIAYLTPADSTPENIWLIDPDSPEDAEQITFSPTGIMNFDISPNGRFIAFSERGGEVGQADIKLLDLETGGLYQLTYCLDSNCTRPVWSPDGREIAYERVEFNSDVPFLGSGPSRIWLIDLTTVPPVDFPLFRDTQILGFSPRWSVDSKRIALFDIRSEGIRVYDRARDESIIIDTHYGEVGTFSPQGARLIYPVTESDDGGVHTILQVADLLTGDVATLRIEGAGEDYTTAAWNPNHHQLAVSRRIAGDSLLRGSELLVYDLSTGEMSAVISDDDYAIRYFAWDHAGNRLVVQRYQETALDSTPGIWLYDHHDEQLELLVENGFHPRWMP